MAKKNGNSAPWLATFADLMSLLMAMFVMLFAMSSVEQDKYEAAVKSLSESLGHGKDLTQSQVQYFQQSKVETPDQQGSLEQAPVKLHPLYESLLQTYQQETAQSQMTVSLANAGQQIQIIFPSAVAFDTASAELKPEFVQMIRKYNGFHKENIRIKVIGHTDSQPINSWRFKTNWELSSARAASVIVQLVNDRVIRPEQAVAIGLADTQPIAQGESEEALQRNRRVEILIEPMDAPF